MKHLFQWIIAICLVYGATEILSTWAVDQNKAYRSIAGVK